MRVVCFGECMVELRPAADGLWHQGFAGDTFNTATYLRRLDTAGALQVHHACGVGDDLFAGRLLEAFAAEAIGTGFVRRIPGRSTGLYAISVDAQGERSFSYWRDTSAARAYFEGEPSPLEQLADTVDVLYLTGISLAVTPNRDRLWALLARLRAAGKRIVFDNNYRPRLWPSALEAASAMERCTALADIALLGLDDVLAMHPALDEDDALQHCLALGAGEVVVKHGARPVHVRSADGGIATLEVQPVKAVDTTGAGDAFAAAYLHARLGGATALQAAAHGCRLSRIVVGHPGAIVERTHMSDFT